MYIVFLSTSNLCSYLLFIIDKYLSALKMNALIVHHKCDCLQIVLIKKRMLRFRNGIPHGSDGTHRENILHSQLTDKANQTKSCMCLYVRMYIYNVCPLGSIYVGTFNENYTD